VNENSPNSLLIERIEFTDYLEKTDIDQFGGFENLSIEKKGVVERLFNTSDTDSSEYITCEVSWDLGVVCTSTAL